MVWLDNIASKCFVMQCIGFSWLIIKSLASIFEIRRCNIFLIEIDTLGNVQKKGNNTIPPHCFGTWCSIRIIIKAAHLCNCVIHQHDFKCIWVEKHNNWYHMMVKSSGSISICWHKFIRFSVIIRYICSGCVFIRYVKKIQGNQLCLLVFECIMNEWAVFPLKIWKY